MDVGRTGEEEKPLPALERRMDIDGWRSIFDFTCCLECIAKRPSDGSCNLTESNVYESRP